MLRKVFFPKDNCTTIARLLFMELQVKVSPGTIEKELTEHPDYPSLLSISDILSNHGIDNLTFKTDASRLGRMPGPFIAFIRNSAGTEDEFTIVRSAGEDVTYYDHGRGRWTSIKKAAFVTRWPTGIALIVDADAAVGENDYAKKVREQRRSELAVYGAWLSLPLLVAAVALVFLLQYGLAAVSPVLMMLLTLAGCIAGGLILWYELGEYNPVLQQLCTAGRKVNCGAVLNSRGAKFMGIKWSAIGFSYFAGTLLFMLFNGLLSPVTLFLSAWINALAVPYVFFSVYYQWRVAKQWCVLCLTVQVLLLLQLAVAWTGGWHTLLPVAATGTAVTPLASAILIPLIVVSLLLPAYRSAKENRNSRTELQRLKHNSQIFEALLAKQKAITADTKGLGITLGNPDAKYRIVKVCNPYCGPCASAHIPMEELLDNNPDVQVQIIFTATTHAEDIKTPPVKHLLAIARRDDKAMVRKALDDWYLADQKDYNAFALKYPVNGELQTFDHAIDAMDEWCRKMEIRATPTFFVNGNQLPLQYSVNDLKYFLSV
jgi:uncharacterized membrane protein